MWQSVQETIVKSAEVIGLRLDDVVVGDVPIQESIRHLNEALQAVRDALAVRDTIALADTLLYEFPPVVGQWRRIVACSTG